MAFTPEQLIAIKYCNFPVAMFDLRYTLQQHETRPIKPAKKEKTPKNDPAKNNRQKATE